MNSITSKPRLFAPTILVVGTALLICFHAAVLLHVIPSSVVWSGGQRIQGDIAVLETISIVVAVIFLWISLSARRAILLGRPSRGVRWAAIGLTAVLVLSVVANIASANPLEQLIFIPVSAVLAACAFVTTRRLQ